MRTHRNEAPDEVVVYSSIRGLLASVGSPLVLVLLSWRTLVVNGLTTGSLLVAAVTAAIVVTVALQIPRHTIVARNGVTRVCLGRRHHLSWGQISSIERARPSSASARRKLAGESDGGVVSGGLLARNPGRRRWMLTDQVESRAEYEQLEALLRACGDPVFLRAVPPHLGALPTDLYRPNRH